MSTEQTTPAVSPPLDEELRGLITKHLPEQTVGALKERLDRLASVEGELDALTKTHGTKMAELEREKRENHQLRQDRGSVERREEEVGKREHACALREQACTFREQVNDLKDSHAKERVEEMRGVVKDVFGNSRFKHERTSTGPVAIDGDPGLVDGNGNVVSYPSAGHVEQHSTTETVEGEGDAPSA